jgi:hypothetical protein
VEGKRTKNERKGNLVVMRILVMMMTVKMMTVKMKTATKALNHPEATTVYILTPRHVT